MSLKPIKGFALIEVVIAVSLLAIVTGISYATFRQIVISKNLLQERLDTESIAAAVMTRLSREVSLALPEKLIHVDASDAPTPRYHFDGQNDVDGEGHDTIKFMAPSYSTNSTSGLAQIEYSLVEDNSRDGLQLIRTEIPDVIPRKFAKDRQVIYPISDRVVALDFTYYDKNDKVWSNTWGQPPYESRPGRVAIRVSFKSDSGEIYSYSTQVALQ